MKRLIFVLVAMMTLMLIAGPIYANGPRPIPPPQSGISFALTGDCKPDTMTIAQLKEWCDAWADGIVDAVGPAVLKFCNSPGIPALGTVQLNVPHGYCATGPLCVGPSDVSVECSVRILVE